MELIPTARKDKLPKLHAYPIGAQIVSEALADVPQYENLRLWFSRYPKSSLVMKARYTVPADTSQLLNSPRYLTTRWDINIYAVPRERNAAIKSHLKSVGLASICEWLATIRTETWLQKSQRFTIRYDLDADVLRCT